MNQSLCLDGDLQIFFNESPLQVSLEETLAVVDVGSTRRGWQIVRSTRWSRGTRTLARLSGFLGAVGLTVHVTINGATVLLLGVDARSSRVASLMGLHDIELRWLTLLSCLLRRQ